MPNHLSQRAFAKAVGLTQGRVSQLVAEGLPVAADGRIDEEAGRRWLDDRLDPARREAEARGRGASTGNGALASVADIRRQKLGREALLLDLELKRRQGQLVERAVFDRARYERDSWLAFASRATAALAGEAGLDPGRAFPILDRLVREHLAELAATALKLT